MKLKKWLLVLVTFAAMVVLCAVCAGAEEYSSGLWKYTPVGGGKAYITAYSGFDSNLNIPSKLDGYTITGIDNYAFSENRNITNIKLPKTIAVIGIGAFKGSSVKKVEIPNSVTTIGFDAFQYSDIVSIDIPSSVTTWDTMYSSSDAFSYCSKLTSVTFNSSRVPQSAFNSCKSLKSVTLGKNVKTIESHAFQDCTSLTKITNNGNIEYIGTRSFINDPITSFVFSDKLHYIGDSAFSNTKLKHVSIPESVTEWGISYSSSEAFSDCANLTSAEIYCKSIPPAAFFSCKALEKVVIGGNVTSIGTSAFNYTAIKEIILPDGLTYFGYRAFANTPLEYISIPSSVKQWELNNILGSYFCDSFSNCNNLKKVVIGSCSMPEKNDLFKRADNVTIYCIKDSEAYKYAKNNGINCVSTLKATPTKSIKFSKEEYTLRKGETLKLYPIVSPANTTDSFKWISGNKDIITIDSNGNITANGTGIAALKYQASNGVYGYCTINVVTSGTTTPDTVRKKDVAVSTVSVANQFYTGKAIKPSVSVNFNSVTPLLLNRDYTVTYANNVNVGTAEMTIKGIGNYTGTVTKSFKITTLAKVTGFKVKSIFSTNVTLQWNKNANASGYEIEQYKDGKWVNVAKITGNATTSYTVKGLAAGTAGYKFRMRAVKNGTYSDYTSALTVNTNPYGVGGFKCSSKTSTSVTLKWNKGTTASGYQLQQYKDGKWVTIYTGTKATNTSYTVKGLKAGTAGYRFRIRAYKTYGSSKQYGSWSSEVKVNTNPYGVGGFKAKSTAKNSITLGWNKGTTASGYQLQQYKGGKWVTVYTGTKATSTSCTIKSLKANTSYKFRIRAYKTYGNTKQYGSWSKVLTVRTKK